MAVAGTTKAAMSTGNAAVDWSKVERIKTTDASGAAHQKSVEGAPSAPWFGAPASPGNLRNNSMFLPWSMTAAKDTLNVTHQGPGKPWLTLQSVAAIALKEPFNAGYQIKRTVTPVEQTNKALPAGSHMPNAQKSAAAPSRPAAEGCQWWEIDVVRDATAAMKNGATKASIQYLRFIRECRTSALSLGT